MNACISLETRRLQTQQTGVFRHKEIKRLLEHAEDKESARPTTGNIDFMTARNAFKHARVDKAENCLCVMCKACYKRVAMAELNGPANERVEGESLEILMEAITERQLKYLKLEHLPIPRVNVKFETLMSIL